MPRFTATVTVHGQLFETPAHCKSSKEAQNTAARIAYDHFTALLPVATPPQIQPIAVAANPPPAASLPAPLLSSKPSSC